MKRYLYTGPLSGVTLSDGTEVMLFPGKEVSFPEGNKYAKTLIAQGYLEELKEEEGEDVC